MFKRFSDFNKFIGLLRIERKLSTDKFVYSKEIIEAKKNSEPIVALETTIITHGMPYPDNYETALNVENIVRKKGAVPATIGIIEGRVHVGLHKEEIKKLGEDAGGPVGAIKCSQRDICGIVAGGKNGGTTVGGTVTIAHLAGIPVMATGGIGGVHRGAEETFDISSDLVVLGKTPVAVVCAGVKAILDIPKTLEFLETLGVPVATIGDTDKFPAFYSRTTVNDIKSQMRLSGFMEAAECIKVQRELGLNSGIIFAVPIPASASLDPLEIEECIQTAILEFRENKINGKDVTPYLLKRITELTKGKSLEANKILIENNAAAAAEISMNFSKLLNKTDDYVNEIKQKIHGSPVVIGGAVLDTVLQCEESSIRLDGRTHKGRRRMSYGGVGRNVTAALVALGVEDTRFVSVVGDDGAGRTIVNSLEWAGVTVETTEDKITARYTGLIDRNGECLLGLGEMDIFDSIDLPLIRKHRSILENAELLIVDGNPPVQTIHEVIDIAVNCRIPVWYEPTDVKKACKIFQSHQEWQKVLHFVSPNVKELFAMAEYFSIKEADENPLDRDAELITKVAEKVGEHVPVVITTMGAEGVLIVRGASKNDPFYPKNAINNLSLIGNGRRQSRIYPPFSKIDENAEDNKYSVSGCGDCLAAGIITGILQGFPEESCVTLGLRAAELSLESLETVPKTLKSLNTKY